MADVASLVDHLEEHGYVVLHGALQASDAADARDAFRAQLQRAVESGSTEAFSKIQTPANRRDLRLRMDAHVEKLLNTAVHSYSELYTQLLRPSASLVELGVMTSHPGSEQQIVHSDVTYVEGAQEIYTTFVALQDVVSSMGPTLVWPGTHTGYFCEFYKPHMLGPVDQYYTDNPPREMLLRAGDALLMDTRVMHCAGSNASQEDRLLFHFSFQTQHQELLPDGFTYHLLPELKGQYRLRDFATSDSATCDAKNAAGPLSETDVRGLLGGHGGDTNLWDIVAWLWQGELDAEGGGGGGSGASGQCAKSRAALDLVRSSSSCRERLAALISTLEAMVRAGEEVNCWALLAFAHELSEDFRRSQECWEEARRVAVEGEAQGGGQSASYHLERMARELRSRQVRAQRLVELGCDPAPRAPREVERRDASGLTVDEFRRVYCLGREPVVITGLGGVVSEEPWTMEWLASHFGPKTVHCSRCAPESMSWASLESHDLMTLREFVAAVREGSQHKGVDASHLYLFDVSMPVHLRELLSVLSIPKYFAHDYLQRTPPGTPLKDSWPTLFIGPKGSSSALHVDQSHTNFYMILMEGEKRWVLFNPDDVPLLYPTWVRGQLDPTFEPIGCVPSGSQQRPLLQHARRMECTLCAGEVLFVPAGAPHFVENLTHTVAVSGNFVDDSNFAGVLKELKLAGLKNASMASLADTLDSLEFEEPDLDQPLPVDQLVVEYEDFRAGCGFLPPRR